MIDFLVASPAALWPRPSISFEGSTLLVRLNPRSQDNSNIKEDHKEDIDNAQEGAVLRLRLGEEVKLVGQNGEPTVKHYADHLSIKLKMLPWTPLDKVTFKVIILKP